VAMKHVLGDIVDREQMLDTRNHPDRMACACMESIRGGPEQGRG
jgi:hypothetical protein